MVCEYISYVHPTDDQNMWSMRSACGMQIDPTKCQANNVTSLVAKIY